MVTMFQCLQVVIHSMFTCKVFERASSKVTCREIAFVAIA